MCPCVKERAARAQEERSVDTLTHSLVSVCPAMKSPASWRDSKNSSSGGISLHFHGNADVRDTKAAYLGDVLPAGLNRGLGSTCCFSEMLLDLSYLPVCDLWF